jgi:GTP-binding protein
MIDKVKIFAKAGDGGHGCTSLRRSRHESKGVPDGACSFFLY